MWHDIGTLRTDRSNLFRNYLGFGFPIVEWIVSRWTDDLMCRLAHYSKWNCVPARSNFHVDVNQNSKSMDRTSQTLLSFIVIPKLCCTLLFNGATLACTIVPTRFQCCLRPWFSHNSKLGCTNSKTTSSPVALPEHFAKRRKTSWILLLWICLTISPSRGRRKTTGDHESLRNITSPSFHTDANKPVHQTLPSEISTWSKTDSPLEWKTKKEIRSLVLSIAAMQTRKELRDCATTFMAFATYFVTCRLVPHYAWVLIQDSIRTISIHSRRVSQEQSTKESKPTSLCLLDHRYSFRVLSSLIFGVVHIGNHADLWESDDIDLQHPVQFFYLCGTV
jgi:hypothetical protein